MVSVLGELRRRNVFKAAIRRYWLGSPLILKNYAKWTGKQLLARLPMVGA